MSGGRPARLALLLGAAALVAGAQIAPTAKVHAAEPVPVVGGSWYWQPQIAPINTPAGPVASPTGPLPTPDVPAGDYAVTAILGQANKESYFHLDASAIPKGSSVQQLTLTLKEDSAGLNLLANTAKVAAYPIVSYFTDGTSAGVWDTRPSFDPSVKGAGKRAADGTWTFDLTPLALKWASGALANNGIALVADAPAAPETWQVVWSGSAPHPSVAGVIVKPEATSGEAATETSSESGADATGDVAATPATESAPSYGSALSPAASALSAPTATEPAATARLQLYRPAVVSEGKPKRAPPVGFYLAGVVLVLLLLLGGVALGDRGEPALERRGSVIRTLERRKDTSA
jgi:hypothetical protein